MVPWKIVHSATSLLNFMASLGIFLAPIMAITIADYWIVKSRHIDVPSLYRRDEKYNYGNRFGTNWRAVVALVCSIGPSLPSLVNSVNPSLKIGKNHFFLLGEKVLTIFSKWCSLHRRHGMVLWIRQRIRCSHRIEFRISQTTGC
jgi:cytosine/uracil/thiamine/allantoin permease